jgi:hypothetical protein
MALSLTSVMLLLEASATLVGKTVVQEATKAAYGKVKEKISELLGRRASDQIAALEANPTDKAAKNNLSRTIQSLSESEQKEIAPLAAALVAAFRQDIEAQRLADEVAAIRLEITGENVVIQRVEGASAIDIKADAQKDFIFTDVRMKDSADRGN